MRQHEGKFDPSGPGVGEAEAAALANERLAYLAHLTRGRLVAGDGQRAVLLFRGESRLLQALTAVGKLLGDQAHGIPAMALADGVTLVGRSEVERLPLLLGLAGFQLERLMTEASPSRVLVTAAVASVEEAA